MLGNLSIEQIEKRSGVSFPDDVKYFLRTTYSSNADLSNGEWHCFDMPYCLVINEGSMAEFEEKVFPILRQGSQISVSVQESDRSRNERLRKEKEVRIAEAEDIHFGNLQRLIRKLGFDKRNDITYSYKMVVEVIKPNLYVYRAKDAYDGKVKTDDYYSADVRTSKRGARIANRYGSGVTKNYNKILSDMVDKMGMCYHICDAEKHEIIMNTKI